MPVTIQIDDGPPASPWLSPAIVPGHLSGNNFSPASGNSLQRGTTYDFKVTVRNTDPNTGTTPPPGSGPVGPFTPAEQMVTGGRSPSGTSHASVSYSAGFPQLELFDAGGQMVWSMPLSSTNIPRNHVYGYSPSGKIFILVLAPQSGGNYDIYLIAAENIGSGTGQIRPGQQIAQTSVPVTGSATTWASSGLGFVPTRNVLYLNWTDSTGQVTIQLIDLGPNVAQRQSRGVYTHPLQAGQVLFSPSGDVMALIGQPAALHNQILLYKTPDLAALSWTRRGQSTTQLTVQLPLSLQSIKPNGFEAIRIQSGSNVALIDSPTPALPAVAVYLWVDTSSSAFSTVTAKQYPQGTSGSQQPPSGFIDRIDRNGSEVVIIDANWRATLPPPGEHFCAIAEAFTTPGTLPADPRQRVGATLSLTERQIAQRNLVVM